MLKSPFCLRVGHLLLYSMPDSNTTHFTGNPSTFILQGIPGLEAAHVWIAIPFCVMYAIAILGNVAILFIVKKEPTLHEPMYYFLCMLAVADLILCTSTVPKMLSLFWFNSREIDFNACLTQIHSTILTNTVVAKIGLAVVLRGTIVSLPYPLLARQWPYCRTNLVPEPVCAHIAVVKLACADTSISSYYGLFGFFGVLGLDVIFIAMSYTHILRAIFRLPTKDAQLKTFWTCSSHLCVIIIFYIPGLSSSLTSRFAQNVPKYFQPLIGKMYLLVPPMLHPIIYGVRTKQIRESLLRLFTPKGP
nr:olfactory receptor 52R1-like [Pelodiscus sinensis]|eukprot:XP_025038289.1 olfactory receptor 52R1-like [Pelodiscus sinensis]